MTKQVKSDKKYVQVMAKIPTHTFRAAKHLLLDGEGGGSWQALLSEAIRDFVLKNLKKKR